MAKRHRFYVGHKYATMTVFKSMTVPNQTSHGHLFNLVVGPFRTKRGAEFFQKYAAGNPHICCVADAVAEWRENGSQDR